MEKSKIKTIYPKTIPGTAGMSGIGSGGSGGRARGSPVGRGGMKRQKTSSGNGAISKSQSDDGMDRPIKQTGHRPVTSCTFCRQHKIKCNASDNFPNPCQRCEKMGLKCEIDPQFRPKKGSQIQSLKSDVDELKAKIEMLTKNESLLTQALNQHNTNYSSNQSQPLSGPYSSSPKNAMSVESDSTTGHETPVAYSRASPYSFSSGFPSIVGNKEIPASETNPNSNLNDSTPNSTSGSYSKMLKNDDIPENPDFSEVNNDAPKNQVADYPVLNEFVLGGVKLTLDVANELHDRFVQKYLPFMPIISTSTANELYHKSQLLFWTVMLTASLSDPEPTLYMSLSSLIKQLAIETCWIRTPRSAHVIQALLILSVWPLPNEKVLDDCSYRFIGLAKNLSLQLGLHRGGEFIQDFSRTQVSLGPDAERWRTRTWLCVFFCEQFWSSVLGLPPSLNTTDYLLENARIDKSLPKNFRCLISLSIFQCKLVNVMGISVTRPDGLLEPSNRAGSLNILDKELERLKFKLEIENGSAIEIYYLYLKLMICCFAFLPGTPIEDQVKYVSSAYLASTRVITITSQMISTGSVSLIELPIYVRHAISYSVFLLFKLHLSPYLMERYVDSARQSIVTVHRMFRNTLSSWKHLQNDISRTAKVLENLNIVLYTYPEVFAANDEESSIIVKMRSHLTASLFYDLVWCIHEARRRVNEKGINNSQDNKSEETTKDEDSNSSDQKRPLPLPFYNQITKDDFKTITTTTPNGTTVTTLVPTDHALTQAKSNANANGSNKPLEINGIPLAMLEATGSVNDIGSISNKVQEVSQKDSFYSPNLSSGIQSEFVPSSSYAVQMDPNQVKTVFSPSQEAMDVQNLSPGEAGNVNFSYGMNGAENSTITGVAGQMDTFFQQQSNGWLNSNNHQDDDFLGWFDTNLMPEN
ncbi:Piso0_004673 [Millerozyma farinosa CBS 7064]|uniref:Piso0_004673 protein n=1 Tax=Pichia sorbitophila (strain ATCC MYA-4447 / BCRC 22081 / CBS 7064 / NBRC 10061 / NRRL Y-12695) TaxID=559304 RepID=G8Y9F6_PICSO|nr:Piso0_004673 [Millerozyma farinosa CBS 7064]CCE85101.1 Piso0_004673 [Millerozyma farinosa CBS 7064]